MESERKKVTGDQVGKKKETKDKNNIKEEKKSGRKDKIVKEEKKIENTDKRNEAKKMKNVAKIQVEKNVTNEVKDEKMRIKKAVKIKEVKKIVKMDTRVKVGKKIKKDVNIQEEEKVEKMDKQIKVKKDVKIREKKIDKKMKDENKMKTGKKINEDKSKKEVEIKGRKEMKTKRELEIKEEKKVKREVKSKEKKEIKGEEKIKEEKGMRINRTKKEVKVKEESGMILKWRKEVVKEEMKKGRKIIGENKIVGEKERTKAIGLDEKNFGFGWNLMHSLLRKMSKTDTKVRPAQWFEDKSMPEKIIPEAEETSRNVTQFKRDETTPDLARNISQNLEKQPESELEETIIDPQVTESGIDEAIVRCDDDVVLVLEGSDFEDIGSKDPKADTQDQVTPDLVENKFQRLEKPPESETEGNPDPEVTESGIDETINRCDDNVVQVREGSDYDYEQDIGSGDPKTITQDQVTADCNELPDDVVEGSSSSEEEETDECQEESAKHFPGYLEIDWDSTDVDDTDSDEDEVVENQLDIQKVRQCKESESVKKTMVLTKESWSVIDEGVLEPPDLSKLDLPGKSEVQSIDRWVVHTKEIGHQRIRPHCVEEILESDDDDFGQLLRVLSSLEKITAEYRESLSKPVTPAIRTNNLLSLEEVEAETATDSDSVITVIENPKHLAESKEERLGFSEVSERAADGLEEISSENSETETLQGQQGSEAESFVSSVSGVEKTDKSSSKGFFRRQFGKCRKKIRSAWKWIRRGRTHRVGVEGSVPQQAKGSVKPEWLEEPAVHWVAPTIPLCRK